MTDRPDDPAPETRKAREMVAKFLSLAGIEDPELTAEAERLLHRQITEIGEHGLRESDLAVIGQAYIRSIGRVVSAETEAVLRRNGAAGGSDGQMMALAEHLLPLGRDVFDVLHGLLLRRAIAESSSGLDRSHRSPLPTAVAHVDVIGSTALLERATLSDTQRLVDGLFGAAQTAIRGRSVEVTKYVGDGVFLAGTEPADVALASLDCIGSLARDVGLKARAGLALGPVVRRAGDVFGLTVNLSHVLTKSAENGCLLATAVEPAHLPAAMCARPRQVTVRGLDAPLEAFELRAEDVR